MCTSISFVATVLTVYGIETVIISVRSSTCLLLQQYLPFTVLKHKQMLHLNNTFSIKLQQYLPFTVLKLYSEYNTLQNILSCNSTYRLRY